MKMTKLLLGSAALVALTLGSASDAKAFDDVDWTWNKEVTSTETIDIKVLDEFDISGLVEIEKTQINIGDVSAVSTVVGVDNNPPGEAEGTTTAYFDTQIDLTAPYDDNAAGNPITDVVINSPGLVGSNGAGNVDNNENEVNMTFDLEGEVEVDLSEVEFDGINDAVDLPAVESVATAVGNNQTIESTVAVNIHDGQYNMGDIGLDGETDGQMLAALAYLLMESDADIDLSGLTTGNTATDMLAIATIGSALGLIQQGEVSATSTVADIKNASVDSSATAVANNLSVDVEANTPGDAFAIADITQFNYADVYANSSVSDVSVNNYANLGVLEQPLVNSVATAVGNNVSISVSSPTVDAP